MCFGKVTKFSSMPFYVTAQNILKEKYLHSPMPLSKNLRKWMLMSVMKDYLQRTYKGMSMAKAWDHFHAQL